MARTIDIETCIDETLEDWSANEAQRDDGVAVLKHHCEQRDGNIFFKPTGQPFDSELTKKWLENNKPHLLPTAVPADKEAETFAGPCNMTRRQALAREIGLASANVVARKFGLRDIFDTKPGVEPEDNIDKRTKEGKARGNPWLDDSERGEARRLSYMQGHGTAAAARMAAAVNRTIAGTPLRKAR